MSLRLCCEVRLEFSDPSGSAVRSVGSKRAELELRRGSAETGAAAVLAVTLKAGRGGPPDVALPVRPPAALYAGRIASEGRLGVRFPRARAHGLDARATSERSVQVAVRVGPDDVAALKRLRDALDAALLGKLGTSGGPAIGPGHKREREPQAAFQAAPPRPLKRPMPRPPSPAALAWRARAGAPPRAHAGDAGEPLPPLSAEQARALDLVRGGASVFVSGPAGTGKSLLLRHVIRALPAESTFVTATTGIAASVLGGTTLNAFAGVGRCEGGVEAAARAAGRGEAAARWRRARALVIDEVSMMDGRLFDTLEAVARRVRGVDAPFGGLQLVLVGDFHQLPPVARAGEPRSFAFDAAAWAACVDAAVVLRQVHRQADGWFVGLLGAIRSGRAPPHALRELLERCAPPLPTGDGIEPTRLFCHRADCDAQNAAALAALPGEELEFVARDSGDAAVLDASCPAPRSLRLKVGAQVMCTKNVSASRGLVNGARGVVVGFVGAGGPSAVPVVRWACGREGAVHRERWAVSLGGARAAERAQVPLALAWAVTVHRSQGLTLDRVEVDLGRAFEAGMAYVALSRVRAPEGLRIRGGIHADALRADARVAAFYARHE